jgi:hypothetical protein
MYESYELDTKALSYSYIQENSIFLVLLLNPISLDAQLNFIHTLSQGFMIRILSPILCLEIFNPINALP